MELTATDKGVTRFVTVDNDILYNRTLQNVIALKKDIVLDFTSLKACLDPQRDGGLEVSAAHAHYVLLIRSSLIYCHQALVCKMLFAEKP